MRTILAALFAVVLVPVLAGALGPHEILLLVNENSALSMEIANRYAAMHGVPAENVVHLGLPDSVLHAEAEISTNDFRERILDPAVAAMESRGLKGRVLAWVYSADFPVRVKSAPAVSIHGATFVRGALPPPGIIATGLYASVLFRGPLHPTSSVPPSATLESMAVGLGSRMPTPAMSLAYCGARGSDRATAIRVLEDGAAAGADWRKGTIHLVLGGDVRARCRQWQFEPAAAELRELGMRVSVSSNFPTGVRNVSGILMGAAAPDPSAIRSFASGAMGEHLTSLAAHFHSPSQTKLSAWLGAGASSSAGTVVEPFAIWTKFPAARFFAHQARGCTLLECYAQSVMCPLQLFAVGDPLSAPAAPRIRLAIRRNDEGSRFTFEAVVDGEPVNDLHAFILDGRRIGLGPSNRAIVDTAGLADGHHRLRAVCYRGREVLHQAFAETGFVLDRGSRAVRIETPRKGALCDGLRPLTVHVTASGGPRGVGVFSGGRKLAQVTGEFPADISIDPALLGLGPVEIQAVAFHADGSIVRSEPLDLTLVASNRPPRFDRVRCVRTGATVTLTAEVSDPEGDAVRLQWFRPAWRHDTRVFAETGIVADDGVARLDGRDLCLTPAPGREFVTALLPPASAREFSVAWSAKPDGAASVAGTVFCATNAADAMFFGWVADRSAWCMGRVAASNMQVRVSRGVPRAPAEPVRLTVRVADGMMEGLVGGEVLCRMPGGQSDLGRVGLLAGGCAVRFTDVAMAGAQTADASLRTWTAESAGPAQRGAVWIRATDGFAETWHREEWK